MVVALGERYTGVYSSDDGLWKDLEEAGKKEGDEVWVSCLGFHTFDWPDRSIHSV